MAETMPVATGTRGHSVSKLFVAWNNVQLSRQKRAASNCNRLFEAAYSCHCLRFIAIEDSHQNGCVLQLVRRRGL